MNRKVNPFQLALPTEIVMAAPRPPLEIFYSYAHEDETLRESLEKHLSLLKRQGVISDWHDREITAGSEWKDVIDEHLESAQIILLLISADFLASEYCYDIEMARALERHEQKQARVMPIILRPVDLEGSPFSNLQCLPKDAKPVTLWENQDAAFTDIAKGIRKAAGGIRSQSIFPHPSPLPGGEGVNSNELNKDEISPKQNDTKEDRTQTAVLPSLPQREGWGEGLLKQLKPHWRWLSITLALLLITLITIPRYYEAYQQHLNDGRYYLNMGQYAKAKAAYQLAIAQHPLRQLAALSGVFGEHAEKAALQLTEPLLMNNAAHLGLEKTDVFEPLDEITIKHKLRLLETKFPNDADIAVLWGKYYVSKNNTADLEKAIGYYQTALQRDPKNAEAYFGLGYIYDVQNQSDAAIIALKKAIEFSSDPPPRYVIQLADLYSQQKQYPLALKQLETLGQDLPLAAFQRADLYRLSNQLETAWRIQRDVITQLDNKDIMGRPDNQAPWYFKTDHETLYLADLTDKQCYVYFSLAATLYLDNRSTEANANVLKARGLNNTNEPEIRLLVAYDLKRLATEKPEFSTQMNAFIRHFLIRQE